MRKSLFLVLIFVSLAILPASSSAQTFTMLANFSGSSPDAGLVQGTDGNFYSTASGDSTGANGIVYKISPSGAFTTLFSFCSNGCQNGETPVGPLTLATNGDFYGTTNEGGVGNEGCFQNDPRRH